MKKHHRCTDLGVCQGLGADQCPDCGSSKSAVEVHTLPRAFDRRATDQHPQPTHPFAPGVIQGPSWKSGGFTEQDRYGLTALQTAQLAVVVILLALIGGYLVGAR